MTDYPDGWLSPEQKKAFDEMPGRAKRLARMFPPGQALRVKPEFVPEYVRASEAGQLICWPYGTTVDVPPKMVVCPVHPGLIKTLKIDGIVDEAFWGEFLKQYGLAVHPDHLEIVR